MEIQVLKRCHLFVTSSNELSLQPGLLATSLSIGRLHENSAGEQHVRKKADSIQKDPTPQMPV